MNLLDNTKNGPSIFRVRDWAKSIMNHEEPKTNLVKLNLELQWQG